MAPIAKAAANCLPVPWQSPDSQHCCKLTDNATLPRLVLTNCLMRQLRLQALSTSTWPRTWAITLNQTCENNCPNAPWPTTPRHQPDTCIAGQAFIDMKFSCEQRHIGLQHICFHLFLPCNYAYSTPGQVVPVYMLRNISKQNQAQIGTTIVLLMQGLSSVTPTYLQRYCITAHANCLVARLTTSNRPWKSHAANSTKPFSTSMLPKPPVVCLRIPQSRSSPRQLPAPVSCARTKQAWYGRPTSVNPVCTTSAFGLQLAVRMGSRLDVKPKSKVLAPHDLGVG